MLKAATKEESGQAAVKPEQSGVSINYERTTNNIESSNRGSKNEFERR